MANYRRFVTYFYQYNKGVRGPICGFGKIEYSVRSRIHLTIKSRRAGREECLVYGMSREKEPDQLLGQFVLNYGKGTFLWEWNGKDQEADDFVRNMAGIVLCLKSSGDLLCASRWDGVEFSADRFLPDVPVPPAQEIPDSLEPAQSVISETVSESANVQDFRFSQNAHVKPEEQKSGQSELSKPEEPKSEQSEPLQPEMPKFEQSECFESEDIKLEQGERLHSQVSKSEQMEDLQPEELKSGSSEFCQPEEPKLGQKECSKPEGLKSEQNERLQSEEPKSELNESSKMRESESGQKESSELQEPESGTDVCVETERISQETLSNPPDNQQQDADQENAAPLLEALFTDTGKFVEDPLELAAASANVVVAKSEDLKESENIVSPVWQQMCRLYPKFMPFLPSCGIECLKIRLGDLGRLPKANWTLANNNFLLHGYYRCHYLVMAKREQEGETEFYVGIPGVYQERDARLAENFGFHFFFPYKGGRLMPGKSGLWMISITLDGKDTDSVQQR